MRCLLLVVLLAPWAHTQPVAESTHQGRGLLDGVFVENRGQWETPARLVAQVGDLQIGVEPGALTFQVQREVAPDRIAGALWRLELLGSASAEPAGAGAAGAPRHFLLGNDAAGWRTSVPSWSSVQFPEAWPGVDLTLDLASGSPALEFRARELEALDGVRLRSLGHEEITESPDGVLRTTAGSVTWRLAGDASGSWLQRASGAAAERSAVLSLASQVDGDTRPRFGLEWSTYLGSPSAGSSIQRLAEAPDGGVLAAGNVGTGGFVVTPGAFDTTFGGGSTTIPLDTFAARLSPDGSMLEWATYLGGGNNERIHALLSDEDSGCILAGWTGSTDFPTTPGAHKQSVAFIDGFVTKLTAAGDALVFSTLIGGSATDEVNDIAWTAGHDLVLAGFTSSEDLPVSPGAFQPTGGGDQQNSFVARLSADGTTLLDSTHFGGHLTEAFALALADTGLVYIAGKAAAGLPVTPSAYSIDYQGGGDGFVSCLDLEAGVLVASTYLGSTTIDVIYDLGIDPAGRPVVTGYTAGNFPVFQSNFPTTPDAYDPTYNAHEDVFVSKFDPTLETLEYSTFVGGVRRDYARALVVEPSGAVVVAGDTDAADFPVTLGCTQAQKGLPESSISRDFFVFRLSPDGRSLRYSTFLGGSDSDVGDEQFMGLMVSADGAATIGGSTQSADFPTTPGSHAPSMPTGTTSQSILARLSLLPRGVSAYGDSTPGGGGPATLGVTSMPFPGNTRFAVTCGAGPPQASGLLALGLAPLGAPVVVGGAAAWVDPATLITLLPLTTDAWGNASVSLPLPAEGALIGATAYAQCFWSQGDAPGSLAASNALELIVQPRPSGL